MDGCLLTDVEILEEAVQRGDALDHPGIDPFPVRRRDDPRQEVHREGALDPRIVAVDGEGDPRRTEQRVTDPFAPLEFHPREAPQPLDQRPVVGPDDTVTIDDLVDGTVGSVPAQEFGHTGTLAPPP